MRVLCLQKGESEVEPPEESSCSSEKRKKPPADEGPWSARPLRALVSARGPVRREMPQGQIPKVPGVLLKLRAEASLE